MTIGKIYVINNKNIDEYNMERNVLLIAQKKFSILDTTKLAPLHASYILLKIISIDNTKIAVFYQLTNL